MSCSATPATPPRRCPCTTSPSARNTPSRLPGHGEAQGRRHPGAVHPRRPRRPAPARPGRPVPAQRLVPAAPAADLRQRQRLPDLLGLGHRRVPPQRAGSAADRDRGADRPHEGRLPPPTRPGHARGQRVAGSAPSRTRRPYPAAGHHGRPPRPSGARRRLRCRRRTGPARARFHPAPKEPVVTDPQAKRIAVLTAAAKAKSGAKTRAAELGIRALVKRGAPVTFQAVQREADVSHAFLYSHPHLRGRIEHLRAPARPSSAPSVPPDSESTLVLALTGQIRSTRCRSGTDRKSKPCGPLSNKPTARAWTYDENSPDADHPVTTSHRSQERKNRWSITTSRTDSSQTGDNGRTKEEQVRRGVEEPQRRQLPDQGLVHAGLGAEVEVSDPPGCRQAGKPQPAGQPARLGGFHLGGQQALQGGEQTPALGSGLVEHLGQRLGRGRQPQERQVRAQPLVALGLAHRRRAHRGRSGAIAGRRRHDCSSVASRSAAVAATYWARSTTTCSPGAGRAPRSRSASANAAADGGRRTLARHGARSVKAASTAFSRATTCPVSRTIAPAPSGSRWCRASTTAPAAMSNVAAPRRWVTLTAVPANAPTVVASPARIRRRLSPTRAQNASRWAWAWVGLSASGNVRHQRCASEWLPFSTTPLRLPCRPGQMSTPAP